MKNKLIYIIVLFVVALPSVQSQAYKDDFKSDICDCLTQEKLKLRLTEHTYTTCFKKVLPDYATLIDASIIEEDTNKKYYKGQQLRKELALTFKYELVYSCDIYFEFLESIRLSKKLRAAERVKESDLEHYNQQVALRPNSTNYFLRAQVQFKLGNLEEAASDIAKSIEANPNKTNTKSKRNELLLLAWIYEEQNRFEEAIASYDKIYLGDFDSDVAILRAIADRKSGSKVSSFSEVSMSKTDDKIVVTRQSTANSRRTTKATKTTKAITKKKDTASLRKLFKIEN